jgi:hypothetical protein
LSSVNARSSRDLCDETEKGGDGQRCLHVEAREGMARDAQMSVGQMVRCSAVKVEVEHPTIPEENGRETTRQAVQCFAVQCAPTLMFKLLTQLQWTSLPWSHFGALRSCTRGSV